MKDDGKCKFTDFINLLFDFGAYFDWTPNEIQIDAWYYSLRGFSVEQIAWGMRWYHSTCDNNFVPGPGPILRHIQEELEP